MRVDHLEIGPGRVVVTVASHETTETCPRCSVAGVYAIATDDGRDLRQANGKVELTAADLPAVVELPTVEA